jgi:hypothetical protein
MYKLIWSEDELLKFIALIMPELTEEEVYFFSLSCRQKWIKLNGIDITAVRKGSSEMFERRIVREKKNTLRTIRKYECNDGAYTFDDGTPMPIEGMAIYYNINPSNMVKATSEFGQKFIRSLAEVALGQGSSLDYIKHMDREILSCLHRSQGTKHYLDIDVDMKKGIKYTVRGHVTVSRVLEELRNKGVKFFLIDTRSGYHILMKKETVKFDYISWLKKELEENRDMFDDLMTNHNRMIPVPGTLQGGHEVKIIWALSNY